MNDLELEKIALQKRLRELEAEEAESEQGQEPKPQNSKDVFSSIFDEPKSRIDKPRTPRTQYQNDPRDNVQNFKVGDFYWASSWRDAHLERQLVSRPQFPNPGQPFASFEEEQRYEDEYQLWSKGMRTLQSIIFATAWKNSGNPYHTEQDERYRSEDLLWANGVLTDEQLDEWSREPKQYAEMKNRFGYQIPEEQPK